MSLTCPTCRTTYPEGTVYCPADTTALLPEEAFANADTTLEPGTMIGEYRIEKKLGEGSFGAVYAGIQPLIGKRVAIKLLHKRMSSDPEIVSRFIDEARAVNKIGHRNIIDVFSFGVYGGTQHYFVMEFCEGMTLGELLQIKKRLTPSEALPILRGIADGLDAAHAAGVTHRDLKPDNVFLVRIKDNQYFPKLLDFGVAKLAREDASQQTATGTAIGTPRYMSPEQCRGKNVDYRSDIYSLGCVAHEMLTGRPVFEADSTVDLLFMQTTEPPPSMSSVLPGLPLELDAPVLEMLAKRPSGRPSSAGSAINALGDAMRFIRASKPSIPPANPTGGTAATVRVPVADTGVAIAGEIARTIPNEPLRAPTDVGTYIDETIPATRKSLTEFDFGQAQNEQSSPDSGNTEIASAPPILSQVPATLASTPLAGAVVDHVPEVKIIGAREIARPPAGARPTTTPTIGGVSKKNAAIVLVGALTVLGAMGLYLLRPKTPPTTTQEAAVPSQTTKILPPEPTTITLRVAVKPAGARIFVDTRDVGAAGSAIVLPREKKEHAVRIELKGYESQTMWVTAEADKQLGPIVLAPLPAPSASASAAASALASAKKAAPATSTKTVPTSSSKNKLNKELLRPKEFGGPK
jgi:eukaryotic-like serine/threonine-protein kinase